MSSSPHVPDADAAGRHPEPAGAALDPATDTDIDDLTALAATLCGTSSAAVGLTDASGARLEARYGAITADDAALHPAAWTWVLSGPGAFKELEASGADDGGDRAPGTGETSFRYHAGVPLVTPDGAIAGALCVFDHQPRTLSVAQRDGLQLLARQVIRRLEHRRSLDQLHHLGRERGEHLGHIRAVVETLATSEQRLSMVLSAVRAGYWDWDLERGVVTFSDRFAEMFQLGSTGPLPVVDVFAALDDQALESLHAALGRLIEGRVERLLHEFRVRGGSTEPVWLRMRGQVTAWTPCGQPQRALGLAIDITAERLKEDDLRHAQRLDSIGALAAGVAHEMNTPLQFVSHNLDFLAAHAATVSALARQLGDRAEVGPDRAAPDPAGPAAVDAADLEFARREFAGAIAESIDGIDRVTTIVQALKEFSHQGDDGRHLVDLNRMIENAITLTRSEWKFVATVERDLAPDLPPVAGVGCECGQLLVNLIVNAAQAIQHVVRGRERGRITVRSRLWAGHVELQVSDTGCGIAPAIRERIFEPFFTTKGPGPGTGQGLATARRIVERRGGTIRVVSEMGLGTTFIVVLPPASDSRAA